MDGRRIRAQIAKELAQIRRDRLTLALAFVLPLMTLLIFGFAIRLEAKDIPVAVQDWDGTALSRQYAEGIYATNQFIPAPVSMSAKPEQVIDRGQARAVVVIPPRCTDRIATGSPCSVQFLIDGSDVNNARVIRNGLEATNREFLRRTGQIPTTEALKLESRIWFNPGREEAKYIVPGVFGVVLWIFPALLAAVAMVREKDQGTIIQIYVSGISALELLLGKAIAYLILGLGISAVVVGLGCGIFGLRLAGDPLPLLLGIPMFLWASISFGLLIGVRASTQIAAVQGVSIVGFLTAFLLSGFIYPLSNIPFPLSLIPNLVPTRYFIAIARDAFVRGSGWPGVWAFWLAMALLGLLFFNAARKGLSRMQLPG
mgnify:CR=1 FL=1